MAFSCLTSLIKSVVDELVKVAEHNLVVPLGPEVHLGPGIHVQLLKLYDQSSIISDSKLRP